MIIIVVILFLYTRFYLKHFLYGLKISPSNYVNMKKLVLQ